MKRDIAQQIQRIKEELAAIGPIHPGSLKEQYNVCGNPGCHCKDPEDPKKHGPYMQLSYTWRGKSTSAFVRPVGVERLRGKVANYKRMRELIQLWVDLEIQRERLERIGGADGD